MVHTPYTLLTAVAQPCSPSSSPGASPSPCILSRSHSLLIPPRVARLAKALSPVLGQSEEALSRSLAFGALSVQHDLSRQDATFILDKLTAIGVTATLEVTPPTSVSRAPEPEVPESGWAMLFPDLGPGSEAFDDSPEDTEPAPFVEDPEDPEELDWEMIEVIEPAAPWFQSTEMPSFGEEPIPASLPAAQIASSGLSRDQMFQAGALVHAFAPEHDQPPYKPDGFDTRGPHSPDLAKLLSTMAPGAGQIYNGQDALALGYGLKFWLLAPWKEARVQAESRAKKIADYWSPRPPTGNLRRALRYAILFDLVVLGVVAGLVIGAYVAWQHHSPEEKPAPLPQQVYRALRAAKTDVLQARINGLSALDVAAAQEGASRSKLSGDERAERLFIRGVESCRNQDFMLCAETMDRVLILKASHRMAMQLQTWATIRRQGAQATMPDLSGIPTLAEFEMKQDVRGRNDRRGKSP